MTTAAALADILVRPDIWRGDRCARAPLPAVPSGFAALDAELSGGWPRGALIELLVDGAGCGELSLLLPALLATRESGGWSLAVAPPHPPHAPAWAAAGVDLSRLLVVSPACERDALWAMEQALASGAPKLVLGWAGHADARALRRLQVAVADSGVLAFLFRPLHAGREASPAPLRLALAGGADGSLALRILKRRGPPSPAPLRLGPARPVRCRADGPALARHPPAVRAAALCP